jgi:hypothetical protein
MAVKCTEFDLPIYCMTTVYNMYYYTKHIMKGATCIIMYWLFLAS